MHVWFSEADNTWSDYLNERSKDQHPCFAENKKCCNFWTSALQHQLKPIMKVKTFSAIEKLGIAWTDQLTFLSAK